MFGSDMRRHGVVFATPNTEQSEVIHYAILDRRIIASSLARTFMPTLQIDKKRLTRITCSPHLTPYPPLLRRSKSQLALGRLYQVPSVDREAHDPGYGVLLVPQ